MDFPTQPTLALEALLFVLGLCVGSFLNVLALRSLAEESVFWPPSKCPKCNHALSPLDNIPLISWLSLGGKCRYCRAPISWQYPVVEFFTACVFVLIPHFFLTFEAHPFLRWHFSVLHDSQNGFDMLEPQFAVWWYIVGALFFAATLIAVTITDFREKLIPHEITYPAMLVGILFSTAIRHDGLGAMAGIGASYIIFDFIAFYGLKLYVAMHGVEDEPVRRRRLRRRFPPRVRRRFNRSLKWRLDLATIDREHEQSEPLEVMGGGDAVLSAVMSAFLGWQLLVMALMIGFIIGTVIGLGLLIREISKAKLLHKLGTSCLISSAVGATVLGAFGYLMLRLLNTSDEAPNLSGAASFAGLGAMGGLMIGVVRVGTGLSKPYPFGPALAAGGMVAIFFLPNWLY